ncbi:hypothetical protein [Mycobacterium sp. E2479]|uniref:hypothetical protein n=1 Tax=Mycobacterium sp. E2479 TaxID=1834134 RepID=UPI0007FFCF7D|nr:hypothetical protein [Mycobacterium sp. E2479]OBH56933.1 hypothetical protein A5686_25865 [Mycobacterium sp. E2479]
MVGTTGYLAAGMLLLVTVAPTACSSKTTIKAKGAAQSVVDVDARQTGFRHAEVHCPSGVEANPS